MGDEAPSERSSAADALARWLHSKQTGCSFATHLAAKPNRFVAVAVPKTAAPDLLNGLLDAAAKQSQPAFLVFPFVRGEVELIEQLNRLVSSPRWRLRDCPRPKVAGSDVFIGTDWITSEGLVSTPMGFGPFATMPVTRRAPHAALAVWPGGRENKLNTYSKPDRIDFLDAMHELDEENYKVYWDRSLADTAALLAEPPDSSRHYRDVAFRLRGEFRVHVRFSAS